jgi:hypothetical protein
MFLTQNDPKFKALLGYLILRSFDFEYADEAADRLEMTLPPGMAKPRPGKPVRQLPPNPLMVAKIKDVEVKQAKVQVEHEKVKVAAAKVEVEKIKAMKELMDTPMENKKLIIEELLALFAPHHPADKQMPPMGGGGGNGQ